MDKSDSTSGSSSSGILPPSSPTTSAQNLIPPRSPTSPSAARGRARSSSIAEMLATPPPLASAAPLTSWQEVSLGSLMHHDKLLSITGDVPVATAYEKMVENGFTSLPVLMKPGVDNTVAESFDYSDITSLLLLVMGHLKMNAGATQPMNLEENVRKARAGFDVPVSFVLDLSPREPFITLQASDTISTAVEYFGRGLHRLLVTDDAETEFMGLLSQRRLVRYLWDNARSFNDIEPIFQSTLHELGIGSSKVISIAGDKLVVEAFEKMHNESVSSLAVIDAESNLLGNISIVDVKHLTKSTSAHLLQVTCLQFLTVILTDRGLENGKDSFPVFHVTQTSTLAHTIAKLVATKSHRMWIVQGNHQAFVSSSPTSSSSQISSPSLRNQSPAPRSASPKLVPVTSPSMGARGRGGKLVGVVSLTDILSVLAKSAGKGDVDPSEARRQRRRSSSSSVRSFTLDKNARRSVSIERGAYAPRGSVDRGSRR
ncbi:uncharacterized protein V2V93DRAFT_366151 [Kockiozyma suomiensis]|uniref:uncharacterized protein n=1 Tax=Kockiozyma suomiensis TaxID=1337062 RepID=UPI0033431A18